MANSGFFRNFIDAIVSSRTKSAEREVARFVETHSYRKLLNEERTRNGF